MIKRTQQRRMFLSFMNYGRKITIMMFKLCTIGRNCERLTLSRSLMEPRPNTMILQPDSDLSLEMFSPLLPMMFPPKLREGYSSLGILTLTVTLMFLWYKSVKGASGNLWEIGLESFLNLSISGKVSQGN